MEIMHAPRAGRIREQLDKHFRTEIGVSVATAEPQWWWDRIESYGSLAILGWAWPVHNPESEWDPSKNAIIVPYCPEIIDEQTAELDEGSFAAYLTLIQYVVDLHIAYWNETADDEERHRRIDAELLDEIPSLHRLLHDALALAALRLATGGFDG